jgi:hypothetical protein
MEFAPLTFMSSIRCHGASFFETMFDVHLLELLRVLLQL